MEVFLSVITAADAALVGNNYKLEALLMCIPCDIKNSIDKDKILTSMYVAAVYVDDIVTVEENSCVHDDSAISK